MIVLLRKLVVWFLDLLYGHFAFVYDFVAFLVSMGDWYRWTNQIIDYLEINDSILEVGIGTGKLIKHLNVRGFSVIGCDRSNQMIKLSTSNCHQENFKIVRADNKYLPFASTKFSKIISTFPSKYIFDPTFQNESIRCLSINGELIILYCVIFSSKNIINKFFQFIYQLLGMTTSKEKIESSINTFFEDQENLLIEWKTYKNVELCILRIKNCLSV